jgi:hypothetical protein
MSVSGVHGAHDVARGNSGLTARNPEKPAGLGWTETIAISAFRLLHRHEHDSIAAGDCSCPECCVLLGELVAYLGVDPSPEGLALRVRTAAAERGWDA